MKRRYLVIVGLFVFITSAMLVHYFTPSNAGHQKSPHAHTKIARIAESGDQETVFICPMHPDVQQSSAGSCPICRMDLVQKKAPNHAAAGHANMAHSAMNHSAMGHSPQPPSSPAITISAAAHQAIALKTAKATKRSLPSFIETVGKVGYNEDTTLDFVPRAKGWVDALHVKHEGIRVNKGDKLLEFYSPEILVAQDGYVLSLKTNYSFSAERREYFDRIAQEKLRLYGMSPEMIKDISTSGELKQTITLQAPQAGVITTLDVDKGDSVSPRDRFMVIADLSSVWVNAALYEHQLPLLSEIQTVTISSSALPGKTWHGTIDYIAAALDSKTNTLPVRLLVKTPKELLKPNMQVDISLQSTPSEPTLVVPTAALIPMQRNQFRLIKVNKDRSYQPVTVVPGYHGTHFTEILSGLEDGDEVVTSGQFLLDSESSLQANIRLTHHH